MIYITEGMLDRYYVSRIAIRRPYARRSDIADILILWRSPLERLQEAGLQALVTVTIDRRILVKIFTNNFEYSLSERARDSLKQKVSDFVSKFMRSTLEKVQRGKYYGLD
jgi:hypothetical protein